MCKNMMPEQRKNFLLDSSLTALLVKHFGVEAVMRWIAELFDQGYQVILTEASGVDNALYLTMPELLKKHVDGGKVECHMYAAATPWETVYTMFGGSKEKFGGFVCSAIPGARIDWSDSQKYERPINMAGLRNLVYAEPAFKGYHDALWNVILFFAKKAMPQTKFDAEKGWTPRGWLKPNMVALESVMERADVQNAMRENKKDKPNLSVRSEGLMFILWLAKKELLKPEDAANLFMDCTAQYLEGLRIQHGCDAIALLDKLQKMTCEDMLKAFQAIYGTIEVVEEK